MAASLPLTIALIAALPLIYAAHGWHPLPVASASELDAVKHGRFAAAACNTVIVGDATTKVYCNSEGAEWWY